MARIGVQVKVDSSTAGNERFSAVAQIADPLAASAFATDQSAFETALATLVADGASPTQAHVTTVNSDYTKFKADFGTPPAVFDAVLSIDLAKVPSKTALRRVLDQMYAAMTATNYLTD